MRCSSSTTRTLIRSSLSVYDWNSIGNVPYGLVGARFQSSSNSGVLIWAQRIQSGGERMTRTKAWIVAAAATATVMLLVLAAGASFGQFGLGGSGASTGALASTPNAQSERREADDDDEYEREGELDDDD